MIRNLWSAWQLVAVTWPRCATAPRSARSRIDVEHYVIDAEIHPRTQTLKATVRSVSCRWTTISTPPPSS